jgi:two-component system sensor histidine kinase/response regulator
VPDYVVGDPTRIRQIIVNLAGNAIKFTDQGEVELEAALETREDGRLWLHFMVRDSGIGIPLEKQSMIFDAFSQADGSTTRRYGGSGLGLAISARLVEAMQGRIWVESEPGKGSCFHFTACLGVAEMAVQAPPLSAAPWAGTAVLVVDDNSTNRRVLTEMLRMWQMKPASAGSAAEALTMLHRSAENGHPFSMVLTDVHMPDMDGFDLVERINRSPKLAGPVIMMLTSGEQRGDLARCRKLGVAAHLTKPVRRAELRASIALALSGKSPGQDQHDATPTFAPYSPRRGLAGSGLRILLTEDNVVNQRVAQRILQNEGHIVVLAGNGREALAALDKQIFDVVLMDVQMPEMDGLEATAAIRQREKGGGTHVPIIAMTAHAMTGDKERCLAAGMDDYLSKPIHARALLDLVEKCAREPVASF